MTRYTVVWIKSVEDRLFELWMTSDQKVAITKATHLIDTTLADDAQLKGGSLAEGLRYLIVEPIRVAFVINEPDRIVEVVSVRLN